MRRAVGDAPSGDSPGGIYAYLGEIVIVRRVGGGTFPISVSHPGTEDGSTFGVTEDEIEPLVEAPNTKPSDGAKEER